MRKSLRMICLCLLCLGLFSLFGSCKNTADVGNSDSGTNFTSATGNITMTDDGETALQTPGDNDPAPEPKIRKIACVGDSLTWGQALNQSQSENPYPKALQKKLGTEGYLVGNFGASGRVMSEGYREATWDRSYNLTDVYQNSLNFGADIVIICLGTNDAAKCDVTSETGKANFLLSARHLIEAYREAGATDIYICLPPYNSHSSYTRVLEKRVLPLIRQVAEENQLPLIDFYTPTHLRNEYLLSDCLHLTDEGYSLMAQIVYEQIVSA